MRLQHVMDVNEILASRKSLRAPFIIKPDLSPTEREIESASLKECWSLIQTGVNRNQIKLRNNCIFVNGQLHREVKSSMVHLSALPYLPVLQSNQWNLPPHNNRHFSFN